ncbi:MAG: hypothetical protein M0Z40_04285, partial [Actinomycetota bacterium]|nr:hypothetical protein [Actinomycetota bacterium]MDA8074443.1 hypothetical protein [Actinomycetota bacterium]
VTDRRAWSWRDLLASFYLHLAHRCAQGRQRPALGGGERPAGLSREEADFHPDRQRRGPVVTSRAAGVIRDLALTRLDTGPVAASGASRMAGVFRDLASRRIAQTLTPSGTSRVVG